MNRLAYVPWIGLALMALACGGSPPATTSTPSPVLRRDSLQAAYQEQLKVHGQSSLEFNSQSAVRGLFVRIDVAEILQVIDRDTCILKTDGGFLWCNGVNTAGLVDGKYVDAGMMRISGTRTYASAIGSTNTIFTADKVPDDLRGWRDPEGDKPDPEREAEIRSIQDNLKRFPAPKTPKPERKPRRN